MTDLVWKREPPELARVRSIVCEVPELLLQILEHDYDIPGAVPEDPIEVRYNRGIPRGAAWEHLLRCPPYVEIEHNGEFEKFKPVLEEERHPYRKRHSGDYWAWAVMKWELVPPDEEDVPETVVLQFESKGDKTAFLKWKRWAERELEGHPHLGEPSHFRSWGGIAAVARAKATEPSASSQVASMPASADFVAVERAELPPDSMTPCVIDECPGGGQHQWDGERVQVWDTGFSVICSKCSLPKIDYDTAREL